MTNNRDASQLAGPPPQPQQPICELVVRRESLPNRYSELLVKIKPNGDLVLEGEDAGGFAEEVWGADYQYSETVPAEFRDTVLLHLMAERFSKTSEFRAWCDAHGIPTQFCAWP